MPHSALARRLIDTQTHLFIYIYRERESVCVREREREREREKGGRGLMITVVRNVLVKPHLPYPLERHESNYFLSRYR